MLMTRPPKFQIDLAEQFPTLQHAPIVEAVIQFTAPPRTVTEPPALRKILEEQFAGYAVSDQVQFEAGLTGSPGNMEVRQKTQWDGFRLTSEDGKHICQWKRNALVFSRLQPYVSWPQFMDTALPFWELYWKTADPQLIEGIGVRFISQIPLRDGERPSRYVQKVPLPLRGLGLRSESFFHQDTIPVDGYPFEVRLMRAMQPAAESTGCRHQLIVDIDVSTTVAVTLADLEVTLEQMRHIKNKVFFGYMIDAEKRFK
jgi:uncharacterized protein (TIGR04255 family)